MKREVFVGPTATLPVIVPDATGGDKDDIQDHFKTRREGEWWLGQANA